MPGSCERAGGKVMDGGSFFTTCAVRGVIDAYTVEVCGKRAMSRQEDNETSWPTEVGGAHFWNYGVDNSSCDA